MTTMEFPKEILSPVERSILKKLSTPAKIQDYLDTLPFNFETNGETYMSVRRTIATGSAHCFEGALVAAAALWYHGERPLIMDLKTRYGDQDHVVALYRLNGYWGAISKTNHAVLRYRDPVYWSVRELALSFFHEYFLKDGRKSLVSYSRQFDLSRFEPAAWVSGEGELEQLVEALDRARHFPIAPAKNMRALRRATRFEVDAQEPTEWQSHSPMHDQSRDV